MDEIVLTRVYSEELSSFTVNVYSTIAGNEMYWQIVFADGQKNDIVIESEVGITAELCIESAANYIRDLFLLESELDTIAGYGLISMLN